MGVRRGEREDFEAIFHGQVAGSDVDEEFRNEKRGDFFGALCMEL